GGEAGACLVEHRLLALEVAVEGGPLGRRRRERFRAYGCRSDAVCLEREPLARFVGLALLEERIRLLERGRRLAALEAALHRAAPLAGVARGVDEPRRELAAARSLRSRGDIAIGRDHVCHRRDRVAAGGYAYLQQDGLGFTPREAPDRHDDLVAAA